MPGSQRFGAIILAGMGAAGGGLAGVAVTPTLGFALVRKGALGPSGQRILLPTGKGPGMGAATPPASLTKQPARCGLATYPVGVAVLPSTAALVKGRQ